MLKPLFAMKYTHAALESLDLRPVFPLPTDSFEQQFQTFGRFTDHELELITRMNTFNAPAGQPLMHILGLREAPVLADMEELKVQDGESLPQARAYRAGACLGVAVIRKHATANLPLERDEWPNFTPGRRYLGVPEWLDPKRANIYGRFLIEAEPERSDYYIDKVAGSKYVEDGEALRSAAAGLKDVWHADSLSVLSQSRAEWTDMYGYVCNGFSDILRLRRTLEYEQAVAPAWQTTFDTSKHFLLDDMSAVTGKQRLGDRFPMEAVTTRHRSILDELSGRPSSVEYKDVAQWMDMQVTHHSYITALQRAVGGFVRDAESRIVLPVGFRQSVETFTLEADDQLVTERIGYGAKQSPFTVGNSPERVAALCSGGEVPFFSQDKAHYSDPELGIHDRSFLYALQQTVMNTASEEQRRAVEGLPVY